jgi:hypothetical protein
MDMGAIAEAIVTYAQPLIDQTDGSLEELNKALTITQLCYNLALLPDDDRTKTLAEMQLTLKMNEEEFDDFRRSVIDPMIRRHQEMFPRLHQRLSHGNPKSAGSPASHPGPATRGEKYPGTECYAPCPCNSGEKYKFCCGARGR